MKHKMLIALGLIVFGWAVFAAVPAEAINGSGSYYATPSWDQTIITPIRFIVLTNMNSEAVLDKETGLVWERSPSTDKFNWENAQQKHCNHLTKGNRMGWRVPTFQELMSLMSTTESNPTLPQGHPFLDVLSPGFFYWSSTVVADHTEQAYIVSFTDHNAGKFAKTDSNVRVWCVRGGQGVDEQ